MVVRRNRDASALYHAKVIVDLLLPLFFEVKERAVLAVIWGWGIPRDDLFQLADPPITNPEETEV
jgi:hypothetical protein